MASILHKSVSLAGLEAMLIKYEKTYNSLTQKIESNQRQPIQNPENKQKQNLAINTIILSKLAIRR